MIDALLFVFGKRAQQIRLKKLSELIHKSHLAPNCQSCTVSIEFATIIDTDQQDGYTIIPNTNFTIKRTVNKQEQSKYYINDKAATFTEIQTFLKGKGIDLDHNRFLILQVTRYRTDELDYTFCFLFRCLIAFLVC